MKPFYLVFATVLMPLLAFGQSLPKVEINYDDILNYNNYIDGSVKITDIDGSDVSIFAKFKTRGATALQYPDKPSMNMKLVTADGEEYDYNVLGLREASSFILDAMAIDVINMRNRVCFDIWNSFSRLPYKTDFGSRNGTVGKFVEVYINNNYKGIYCLTDKVNRKMLGLKKPKTGNSGELESIRGVLYKHGTTDIENQNDVGFFANQTVYVAAWHDAWELHEPDDFPCDEAWAPLVDLYVNQNFNNFDYVKSHFDLDNLSDFTVFVMTMCLCDNWGNKNKYFSIANIQDELPKFYITPWDLDTSLGGEFDGSKFGGDYLDWPVENIPLMAPLPLGVVFGKPEFESKLKASWERGRTGAFDVDSVKQRLNDYADLFIESGAWERSYANKGKTGELLVDDLKKEIELIGKWYEARFDEMDEYFGVAGVEDVTVGDEFKHEGIYNLNGVRLENIQTPGIYIVDGKKRLILP